MPILSEDQIKQYNKKGYVSPIQALTKNQAQEVKEAKNRVNLELLSKKLNTFTFKKNTNCDLLIYSLGYNFNRVSYAAKNLGFQVGALQFGSVLRNCTTLHTLSVSISLSTQRSESHGSMDEIRP